MSALAHAEYYQLTSQQTHDLGLGDGIATVVDGVASIASTVHTEFRHAAAVCTDTLWRMQGEMAAVLTSLSRAVRAMYLRQSSNSNASPQSASSTNFFGSRPAYVPRSMSSANAQTIGPRISQNTGLLSELFGRGHRLAGVQARPIIGGALTLNRQPASAIGNSFRREIFARIRGGVLLMALAPLRVSRKSVSRDRYATLPKYEYRQLSREQDRDLHRMVEQPYRREPAKVVSIDSLKFARRELYPVIEQPQRVPEKVVYMMDAPKYVRPPARPLWIRRSSGEQLSVLKPTG